MSDDKYLVLCIDDDQDVLDALRVVLEGDGYQVEDANSAEAGLRKLGDISPAAVIVDLMMEEIDSGLEFVRKLKGTGCVAPVYMLSSVGDSINASTSYSSLGLSGVFQKPINGPQLLEVLRARIGRVKR